MLLFSYVEVAVMFEQGAKCTDKDSYVQGEATAVT